MTVPSISNLQPPPPPYSQTDNNPTSIHQLGLNGSVQDQGHQIQSHAQSQVQAQVQAQGLELVSAAETLSLFTRNTTPPSDAETVAMDDASPPSVILPPIQHQRHPIVSTVSMVARHPIVMNAVKYYETSKRNYPSFNYAAGIVESAAIPVVNNIEAKLNTRHQTRQASAVSSTDITPTNSNFGDYKIQHDGNLLQKKRRFSTSSQTTNISSYSSIDTRKRLQFCINILKLANTNINSKVEFLQEKINETEIAVKEEREKLNSQKSNDSNSTTTDQATQKTKTEIIGTVKKIIHLISNFRPSSLGDTTTSNGLSPVSSNGSQSNSDFELKNAIRDIIMSLPQSLQHQQQQQQQQQQGSSRNSQDDVIFKFAKESLVMISKLTQIFTEKLDQVEHWVNGDEEQNLQLQLQLQLPEGLEKQQEDEKEEENLAAETKRMKLDGSV